MGDTGIRIPIKKQRGKPALLDIHQALFILFVGCVSVLLLLDVLGLGGISCCFPVPLLCSASWGIPQPPAGTLQEAVQAGGTAGRSSSSLSSSVPAIVCLGSFGFISCGGPRAGWGCVLRHSVHCFPLLFGRGV
jgi:hypothetical protein